MANRSLSVPLIVPSFSSRGFPQARRDLDEVTRNHFRDFAPFFEAILVSAFDLHFGYVDPKDIPQTSTVFVDSGGYESREWEDDSATHLKHLPGPNEEWTADLMMSAIAKLPDEPRFVFVNLDLEDNLVAQVRSAHTQLQRFRSAKKSFLLKEEPTGTSSGPPSDRMRPLAESLADLPAVVTELATFDVFGVPEKSLGASYAERLANLQLLSGLLKKHGLNLPIHVFGALDPLTVRAYVMAGGDIFDGLTWIRYAYRNNQCVYLGNDILAESDFSEDLTEGKNAVFARNYGELIALQNELRSYRESQDLGLLKLDERIKAKVIHALNQGRETPAFRSLIGA